MPLTLEEITSNTELKDLFIDLQNEIIASNDKALLANLLDKSGRVILSRDGLEDLISNAVGGKIKIKVEEDPQKRSCGCGKGSFTLQVYGDILDIKVNGESLEEAEPVLYKFLTKTWNISLTRTYLRNLIDIEVEPVQRSKKQKKVEVEEEEEDEEVEEESD